MPSETALHAGSSDWFAMVGEVLLTAARAADLPAGLNVSLVEHYIDGPEIKPGLFQGLRFGITNGVPSFRMGVMPGETGDITIHVTVEVAQRLNQLYASDPHLVQVQQAALANDQFRMLGDPSRLGTWFVATHDEIVRRTAGSSPLGHPAWGPPCKEMTSWCTAGSAPPPWKSARPNALTPLLGSSP